MIIFLVSRLFFFLMIRRPPRSTRPDTLFPDTTLFRSADLRRGILARERTAARQPEWRIPAGADADGIRYRRAEGALSAAHGVGTGHLGARLEIGRAHV